MIRPITALSRVPALAALLLAAVGILFGLTIRLILIEPAEMGSLCRTAPELWQCGVRNAVIVAMNLYVFGAASLLAAIASLCFHGRAAMLLVAVAMLLGGTGIFLFNATLAAGGLLLGLLRASRLGEQTPEPQRLPSDGANPR